MNPLLLLLAAGAVTFLVIRPRLASASSANFRVVRVGDRSIIMSASTWKIPPAGQPYAALIRSTEQANGIPTNLLAKLLHQESRFNPRAVSPAGAQGIAQVMPATARSPGHGVPPLRDPFDPNQAIPWAGKYLRAMYNRTGSWRLALAAYNGGLGNVEYWAKTGQWPRRDARGNIIGTKPRPAENVDYVATITRDVPVA